MKHDFRITDNKVHLAPLKTVPHTACGCIEHQKAALYSEQLRKRMLPYTDIQRGVKVSNHFLAENDHADQDFGEDSDRISYYLDSLLIAKKPIKIWSLPGASKGGTVKNIVPVGGSVGKIYSWVKDKNGIDIWLQLVAPETPSDKVGTAPIIGYTPFFEGYFDKGIATSTSSGKKFVDEMTAISDDSGFSLPSFGNLLGSMKWYLIAILAIIMLAVFLRIKG